MRRLKQWALCGLIMRTVGQGGKALSISACDLTEEHPIEINSAVWGWRGLDFIWKVIEVGGPKIQLTARAFFGARRQANKSPSGD